jgi:hypothetical protein
LVNDILGPFLFIGKFYWIIIKIKCIFYFIVTFHVCLVIKETPISPTLTFEFFEYFFFQHTNNIRSDLINRFTPKPPLSMTLVYKHNQTNRRIRSQQKNCYRFTHHSSYMMQWWVFFHYYNHIVNPMFSLKWYIRIQVQLPFFIFFKINWTSFLINSVTYFHLKKNLSYFFVFFCVILFYVITFICLLLAFC